MSLYIHSLPFPCISIYLPTYQSTFPVPILKYSYLFFYEYLYIAVCLSVWSKYLPVFYTVRTYVRPSVHSSTCFVGIGFLYKSLSVNVNIPLILVFFFSYFFSTNWLLRPKLYVIECFSFVFTTIQFFVLTVFSKHNKVYVAVMWMSQSVSLSACLYL